ncbi:MAG TPA: STAS domain-containing protein [Gemmatimonadaceae bacterium]|nr:STAS domain-containing protein [Gemmatimonadaceae bacterium]
MSSAVSCRLWVGASEIVRVAPPTLPTGRRKEAPAVGASGASSAATFRVDRSAQEPGSVVLRLSGRIGRADVAMLGARAAEALAGRHITTAICDVRGLREPDAAAVDAVCRIRLAARRHRCEIVLCGAPKRLLELLDLMGLCDAFPLAPGDRSGVQPRR